MEGSMKTSKYRIHLIIQMILTMGGALLALYTLVTTFASQPTVLSALFAIIYVLSYAAMIAYATTMYRRNESVYFQLTVYAYLMLLGIQILQNGNFMSDMGLGAQLLFFINTANLVAFANVIKFVDKLNEKRLAVAYLAIAVLLKLAAELALIVAFIDMVQLHQVLMALSVPVLGTTLLVAYLSRRQRLGSC